jgi:hypothetical protein
MNSIQEIRREKVFIPPEMTIQEIQERHGLSRNRANQVKKQGFFVKNYSRKQIIIDPQNFDATTSYKTAWKVFWKNFSRSSVAQSIKHDLVQEAVTRMYELSGKVKENANERFGVGYGYFWVAHNAMLSYLKTWKRQMRFQVFGDINDEEMAIRIYNYRKELIL